MGRPPTSARPVSFRLSDPAREILREVSAHLGKSQVDTLDTMLLELRSLHPAGKFPEHSILFTPSLEKPQRRPVKTGL